MRHIIDMDESSLAALEHGWQEVEDHWSDPEAHKRLIALGDCMGELVWVAKQYRQVASANPQKADIAQENLNRVLALSMSRLDSMRVSESLTPGAPDQFKRWLLVSAVVLTAIMVWYTFSALLRALQNSSP